MLVGATLAVVGTVLQAMVRNPLADPTILGGTAGAAVGAVAGELPAERATEQALGLLMAGAGSGAGAASEVRRAS